MQKLGAMAAVAVTTRQQHIQHYILTVVADKLGYVHPKNSGQIDHANPTDLKINSDSRFLIFLNVLSHFAVTKFFKTMLKYKSNNLTWF